MQKPYTATFECSFCGHDLDPDRMHKEYRKHRRQHYSWGESDE